MRRYKALLTQQGENDPVAHVKENSLGSEVVWTRIDQGGYRATLPGVTASSELLLMHGDAQPRGGQFPVIHFTRWGDDSVQITTWDVDINGPAAFKEDTMLDRTAILIEV